MCLTSTAGAGSALDSIVRTIWGFSRDPGQDMVVAGRTVAAGVCVCDMAALQMWKPMPTGMV